MNMLLFTILKSCSAEELPCEIPNKKAPKEQKFNTKILVQIGNAENLTTAIGLSITFMRLHMHKYVYAYLQNSRNKLERKKIHC